VTVWTPAPVLLKPSLAFWYQILLIFCLSVPFIAPVLESFLALLGPWVSINTLGVRAR
jgi:hypothetical protein